VIKNRHEDDRTAKCYPPGFRHRHLKYIFKIEQKHKKDKKKPVMMMKNEILWISKTSEMSFHKKSGSGDYQEKKIGNKIF